MKVLILTDRLGAHDQGRIYDVPAGYGQGLIRRRFARRPTPDELGAQFDDDAAELAEAAGRTTATKPKRRGRARNGTKTNHAA